MGVDERNHVFAPGVSPGWRCLTLTEYSHGDVLGVRQNSALEHAVGQGACTLTPPSQGSRGVLTLYRGCS